MGNLLFHSVKIGSLELPGNLFLAPIAGYSDRAFRAICVECGASFCTTEMVSSEALVRGNEKTEVLMLKAPEEKEYAVQIFGGNPEVMGQAAKIVLEKTPASMIDINAGCPVPKITKTGAGSSLTREPEKLYKVVKNVNDSVEEYLNDHPDRQIVPVTVKIRSGWGPGSITWKEAAQAAIDAGAKCITIHARTREQGYEGKADWNIQKQLVEYVAGRIPVFGSGDAWTPEDAKRMLEETGVDGVMFARGAMGDPFLFKRTKDFLTTGAYSQESVQERLAAGFKELKINVEDKGEKLACMQMRKKFCCYTKGLEGGAGLRKEIVAANTVEDFTRLLAPYLLAPYLV